MKVLNEYSSHHYWEEYSFDLSYYCPSCGSKGMWIEQGPGDYYLGSDYVCTKCTKSASLVHSGDQTKPDIIEQLKTGKTNTPTTPKGH